MGVDTLQDRLDNAIMQDFLNLQSDNFYHTSGRFEAAQRYIRELKRQIAEETSGPA